MKPEYEALPPAQKTAALAAQTQALFKLATHFMQSQGMGDVAFFLVAVDGRNPAEIHSCANVPNNVVKVILLDMLANAPTSSKTVTLVAPD